MRFKDFNFFSAFLSKKKTEFIKTFLSVASLNGINTFVQVIFGIYLIRIFTPEQYAFYILSLIIGSLIKNISNAGLKSALLSNAATYWRVNHAEFSVLFSTGIHFKKKMLFIVFITMAPYIVWVLLKNNYPTIDVFLMVVGLLPSIIANTYSTLQGFVLELDSKQFLLTKANFYLQLIRGVIILILVQYFIYIPLIVFIGGMLELLLNLYFKSYLVKHYSLYKKGYSKEKLTLIKRDVYKILPISIFRAIRQEIRMILVSIFGGPQMIAGVGALSKIQRIYSLFNNPFDSIFIADFSKKKHLKKQRLNSIKKIFLLKLLGNLMITALVIFLAEPILEIFGSNYSNLKMELLILSLAFFTRGLNMGRYNNSIGYILKPYIVISIHTLFYIITLLLIPMDTVYNIVIYSLINSTLFVCFSVAVFFYFNHLKQKTKRNE